MGSVWEKMAFAIDTIWNCMKFMEKRWQQVKNQLTGCNGG